MSELVTFIRLGFRHIVDLGALDHILFLFALAAIYRPREWRDAVWVVSAFTVGHSVTLGLAVTGALVLPTPLIEFLIPLTIVATAVENIAVRERRSAPWRGRYRPVFAGMFGLVHGAGFANYLRSLFVDQVALPLFGFNVGIELGQLVVLMLAAATLLMLDRALVVVVPSTGVTVGAGVGAPRLRVVAVSAAVALVAAHWAVERIPL
jgi:HupE/UreJ protein